MGSVVIIFYPLYIILKLLTGISIEPKLSILRATIQFAFASNAATSKEIVKKKPGSKNRRN